MQHSGIDIMALSRVLFKTILLRQKNAGGGSTITQQLAKQQHPQKKKRPNLTSSSKKLVPTRSKSSRPSKTQPDSASSKQKQLSTEHPRPSKKQCPKTQQKLLLQNSKKLAQPQNSSNLYTYYKKNDLQSASRFFCEKIGIVLIKSRNVRHCRMKKILNIV